MEEVEMANLIRRNDDAGSTLPSRVFDPFEMMRDFMRWDPFAEPGSLGTRESGFTPRCEVKETTDAYVFKADLPGIKDEDLDLSFTGNRLTVSGKRLEEKHDEDDRFYAYERTYGSFSRSFTLPEGIDPDHAEAVLSAGVLTVTIPKRPEVRPRKLEVKKLPSKSEVHA
jgi:HSP20 family protein